MTNNLFVTALVLSIMFASLLDQLIEAQQESESKELFPPGKGGSESGDDEIEACDEEESKRVGSSTQNSSIVDAYSSSLGVEVPGYSREDQEQDHANYHKLIDEWKLAEKKAKQKRGSGGGGGGGGGEGEGEGARKPRRGARTSTDGAPGVKRPTYGKTYH
jgi:hypothetical protein